MLAFRISLSSSRRGVQGNTEWNVVDESFSRRATNIMDRQTTGGRQNGRDTERWHSGSTKENQAHPPESGVPSHNTDSPERGREESREQDLWPAVPLRWKPTFPGEKLSLWTSVCSSHRQCLSTVYSHLMRVSVWACWPVDLSVESQIDYELRWKHPHGQHHSLGRTPIRAEKVSRAPTCTQVFIALCP